MRAIAIDSFGGIPALVETPEPRPGPNEILVRIHAAGVNPFDWKIADGILRPRPHVFPLVLGIDGAGIVTRIGPEVTRFHVGDRVAGQFLHDPVGIGTYAEFSTVPETNGIAEIPPGMGFAEAAALPTAGMTALDAVEFLRPVPGANWLIVGASGGVGSYAVQLARARGVRVIGTARGAGEERLRKLGVEQVIDPGKGDLASQVRAIQASPLDALLDLGSDAAGFARNAELVRAGGAAASTVYVAAEDALARRGVRGRNISLQPRKELLEPLLEEVARGGLRVPIESEVPLEEAPRALAESRSRGSVGKTVIRLLADP